jgi:predicted GIY-YIG superfamily endonuclease
MARKKNPGTVYLIHLESAIAHSQHYIGWTKHLSERIAHHKNKTGARFLQVAVELNIDFDVVRTWEGDKNLERKLKNQKNARRICPICQKKH